jgi:hypothetical protein
MLVQNFFFTLYSVCMIVLVTLWLQSGFDKVKNFKGNYDWFKGQFSKSPLKGMVRFMLITLTLLELSAGFSALGAMVEIWFFKSWNLPFITCFLSLISLAALFFGQRMSKEYGGAASLMGYFSFVLLVTLATGILYERFGVKELPFLGYQF